MTWQAAYGKALSALMKKYGEKTGKYELVAELSFATMPADREVKEFLPDFGKRGVDIICSNSTVQTSAAIMKGTHHLGLSKEPILFTPFPNEGLKDKGRERSSAITPPTSPNTREIQPVH